MYSALKGKVNHILSQDKQKPEEINLQRCTRSKKRKEHKHTMKVNTHRRIELNNTYTTKSREHDRCFIWVSRYSSTFDIYRVILAMAKVR